MRTAPQVVGCMILTVATSAAWAESVPRDADSRSVEALVPNFTRQREFAIPFGFDEGDWEAQKPVEVQLYVSEDFGGHWNLHAKVPPDRKTFSFRANHDGQYWFMVRTKDQAFNLRPQRPAAPELKVVVDTTLPTLEMTARRGAGGEVHVAWQAADANLDSQRFKLEYQLGPETSPWQPIAVEPPTANAARTAWSGGVTFVPQGEPGAISLRAEIADRAGNRAVSGRRLEAARSSPFVTAAAPGAPERGWTSPSHKPSPSAELETVEQIAAPKRAASSMPPAPSTNWPAEQASKPALSGDPPRMPHVFPESATPAGAVTPEPVGVDEREAPELVAPAADSEAETGEPALDDAFQGELVPPGQRPRLVNSKRFELEYEVESVGPAGIAQVELWGTRDGGESWTSFGVDADNRSPMLVTVDREGSYGFRMVVESGTGLRGPVPQSGDLPDVAVIVDLTRPVARIVSAEPGTGPEAGDLVIHWLAEDRFPAPRPVSIWFSSRPDGPWSALASGLENSGRYAWRLDHRVGEQVYLRLEVSDAAGNVQVFDTPQAISIDRARPQGRIRYVRPLEEARRRSKMVVNPYQ